MEITRSPGSPNQDHQRFSPPRVPPPHNLTLAADPTASVVASVVPARCCIFWPPHLTLWLPSHLAARHSRRPSAPPCARIRPSERSSASSPLSLHESSPLEASSDPSSHQGAAGGGGGFKPEDSALVMERQGEMMAPWAWSTIGTGTLQRAHRSKRRLMKHRVQGVPRDRARILGCYFKLD